MGQVSVQIGGRSYAVACAEGDEPRVRRLAQYIDKKAEELTGALGQMSEPRLLFMAGLMITDELYEIREKGGNAVAPPPASGLSDAGLDALASRINAIADALEKQHA